MSSILHQLSDADLESIRHMIRRDAHTDLAIAREVESRLPDGAKLGETDAAKGMVIHRYRKSAAYAKWLHSWENQDAELKKSIALEKQRLEYLQHLVQGEDTDGMGLASSHLMGRLLVVAASAKDEDLKAAMEGKGWLSNLLREVREYERSKRVAGANAAAEIAGDEGRSLVERQAAIRELFGK